MKWNDIFFSMVFIAMAVYFVNDYGFGLETKKQVIAMVILFIATMHTIQTILRCRKR